MAPSAVVILGLLLVLVVGAGDYTTGRELNFSVFYLLPVCLVAWFVGRTAGIWIAITSTLVWAATEFTETPSHSHLLIPFWNSAVRLGFLLVVVYTVSALKRALEREKELARTDPLTAARNSRFFNEALEGEIRRLRRYERAFTLVYLDVDNFKLVNDQHGHSTGDELLHQIADTLRDALRRTDTVARLGGDEFAVLLPETGPEAAQRVLGKLEQQLAQVVSAGMWPVTFSIGAVTLLDAPDTVDACLEMADKVMYAAKNTGKNRILHEVVGTGVRAGL